MLIRIGLLLSCTVASVVNAQPLSSPQLEVSLDQERGLPAEYRLRGNQAIVHGAEPGRWVTATVFQLQPHRFESVAVKPVNGTGTNSNAEFAFTAQLDGRAAA